MEVSSHTLEWEVRYDWRYPRWIQNEKFRCSEGYLGIIQRGKDVADMEYITTTEPELSSRSLAQSYKAALAQDGYKITKFNSAGFSPLLISTTRRGEPCETHHSRPWTRIWRPSGGSEDPANPFPFPTSSYSFIISKHWVITCMVPERVHECFQHCFKFEQYIELPANFFKVNSEKSLLLVVEPMPMTFESNSLIVTPLKGL